MNKLKLLLTAALIGIYSLANAQISTLPPNPTTEYSGWRASIRGGYDFPSYKMAPIDYTKSSGEYIHHKGGVNIGASIDHYWNWIGLGIDFDYIQNQAKNAYPTNLFDWNHQPFTKFNLNEEKITRIFYGIGPSFKFLNNPKGDLEFKLRGGLVSIKGGSVAYSASTNATIAAATTIPLNTFSGYDLKNLFTGKASLQYNYFFNKNVGINVGGYYMNHFKTMEKDAGGIAYTFTIPFKDQDGTYHVNQPSQMAPVSRGPEDAKINSFGVFAGLTFRFNKKEKIIKEPKVEIPAPIKCNITVTAKDKYTGKIIPNAQITLLDEGGNIVKTGTTNASGMTAFNAIEKGNYTIKGIYQNKTLEGNTVATSEFENCVKKGGIRKDVLLNNENFIVMGKVVNCKTSEPISDASVIVKNNKTGTIETYISDAKGEFIFNALPNTTYTIYGKKANYLSQNMTLKTSEYNRTKSQYIQIQICMDKADCNDAIILKDILYDLDKWFIREDAKPELNRLVQFMNDNPEVRVELSSHTDSRASHAYNDKLSQRRAQAAVDYLVSQGIAKSRLIAKGYGERKLLNKCADGVKCTEEEHQLNRRTEMKVVCPDNK